MDASPVDQPESYEETQATAEEVVAAPEEEAEEEKVAEDEEEEEEEESTGANEVLEYYRMETIAAEAALEASQQQVDALTGEVQLLRGQLGHAPGEGAATAATGAGGGTKAVPSRRRMRGDKKQERIEALARQYEPEGVRPAASRTASSPAGDGDDEGAASLSAAAVAEEVESAGEEEGGEEASSVGTDEVVEYFRKQAETAETALEASEQRVEALEAELQRTKDQLEEALQATAAAAAAAAAAAPKVTVASDLSLNEAAALLRVEEDQVGSCGVVPQPDQPESYEETQAKAEEVVAAPEEEEDETQSTDNTSTGGRDYEKEIADLQEEVRTLQSIVDSREVHGGTVVVAQEGPATRPRCDYVPTSLHDATIDPQFRETVERGLVQVKKVLDNARNPKLAADVPHGYTDKFLLAEFLTGAGCAGVLLCLETLGVTAAHVEQLQGWVREGRSVTLRVRSTETCEFEKKTSREIEGATQHVTEVEGCLGTTKVSNKVVRRVDEWFWGFGATYQVVAYGGTDVAGAVVLREGARRTRVKTAADAAPREKVAEREVAEVDATWLVRQLNASQQVEFRVDRAAKGCHTPRRNAEVEAALAFFREVRGFFGGVERYLAGELFPLEQDHKLDVGSANAEGVFVPLLPLLEEGGGAEGKEEEAGAAAACGVVSVAAGQQGASGTVLGVRDLAAFLREERRALEERVSRVRATLAGGAGLITAEEGVALVVADHAQRVAAAYAGAMAYVEQLLRQQVVAAIGKEVTSGDFTEYMRYHLRKLLADAYAPRGFSYAVRRGKRHNPEGTVSLEQTAAGGGVAEPVVTVVRRMEGGTKPMRFELNASSEVRFGGERFVHSYICHRFSTEAMPALQLVGRARQFSGFVLLVGAIGGADVFLPKAAMIVQNKDDFKLPLLLDEIPTPKEFRKAVESLSPEQRRFAKAYRGMQLEATLFGVCVVQIKPQLERVLNLPADSLTKEIKLTQDLLELFMEFQIPSDLLSYQADACEDDADVSGSEKVEQVRGHVAAMKGMLKEAKEAELEEERMVREKMYFVREDDESESESESEYEAEMECCMGPPAPSCSYEDDEDDYSEEDDSCEPLTAPPPAPPAAPAAPVGDEPETEACMDEPVVELEAHEDDEDDSCDETGTLIDKDDSCDPLKAAEPAKPAAPTPKQEVAAPGSSDGDDVSKLPQVLERKFEALDEDSCLRPTILETGEVYQKTHQKGLLSKPATQRLHAEAQKQEKDRAYDLLDALTRSGALDVEEASLHVVVASTHCFDKTLMDAVVQDNVNPIEKVERSVLIAASAIHCRAAEEMLREEQVGRVKAHCPQLFLE